MDKKILRLVASNLWAGKRTYESFYEAIFVLLEVYKNEEFMKDINEILLKDLLITEWKNGNKDDIIKKSIMYSE